MKMRFHHIFSLGLILAMLLSLGTLSACGRRETAPAEGTAAPAVTATPAPTATPEAATAAPEDTPSPDPAAPETLELTDMETLEAMLNGFSEAYFAGDAEGVESFLSTGFYGEKEVYEGPEATDPTVQVFGEFTEAAEGEVCPARITFVAAGEDSYTYLSLEAVKEDGAWKVQFYGLEK